LAAGASYVSDPIGRITSVPVLDMEPVASLRRQATAFFQANRFLLTRLTDAVIGACGDGGAIDLYSGVGLFAVALAAAGRGPVVAVEGDSENMEDLTANVAAFGDAIRLEHTSVESFMAAGYSPTTRTVIVDPPRTGISRAAMTLLLERRPRRLVYVSCDAPTLARDVKALAGRGYRISQAEAFDLFPNTAHVETLVVVERNGN
jgi:23S rRNA (uracil1939-C5)-methyltransferase